MALGFPLHPGQLGTAVAVVEGGLTALPNSPGSTLARDSCAPPSLTSLGPCPAGVSVKGDIEVTSFNYSPQLERVKTDLMCAKKSSSLPKFQGMCAFVGRGGKLIPD